MSSLNDEFAGSAHAGHFESVHSVPVPSTYDAEQYLFAALNEYRIIAGREYFLVDRTFLRRVMDFTSAYLNERPASELGSLGTWPSPSDEIDCIRRGASRLRPLQASVDGGGWVVVLRNEVYRSNVYRLGFTRTPLAEYKARLDYEQRARTSELGFFAIVVEWPHQEPQRVVGAVLQSVAIHRVGQTTFVDMPLQALDETIQQVVGRAADAFEWAVPNTTDFQISRSALASGSPRQLPTADRAQPTGDADSKSIDANQRRLAARQSRPKRGEQAFASTCPYPRCFGTVRATGRDGITGEVLCGTCRRLVGFEVANGTINVWRDRL